MISNATERKKTPTNRKLLEVAEIKGGTLSRKIQASREKHHAL